MTKMSDLKPGDKLKADGGFSCLKLGEIRTVQSAEDGLFITCNKGRHYLNGQTDETGKLIGLDLFPEPTHASE